jgi:hypothetical protein
MRPPLRTLLLATTLIASTQYALGTNAAGDFDLNNNPTSQSGWSYGFKPSLMARFQLLSAKSTANPQLQGWTISRTVLYPDVTKNISGGSLTGNAEFVPNGALTLGGLAAGPNRAYAVVRWTAASANDFILRGSFSLFWSLRTDSYADVHILLNGVSIFSSIVTRQSVAPFSQVITVQAGDTVDFVGGLGDSARPWGRTILDATISPVPENALPPQARPPDTHPSQLATAPPTPSGAINSIAPESPGPLAQAGSQDATLPAELGKRVALVIGNARYNRRPLLNPENDAHDMSSALRASGFSVIELKNATLPQMRGAVRAFGDQLLGSDVGLVFYAGHAVEVRGRNYLIPVNADIQREDEISDQGLDAGLILEKMASARKGVNILIIDACRDDPFGRGFRNLSRGLAQMEAPQGTLIAYATSPGKVASDGDGRNSPYTKHLLRSMKIPNLPIEQMFKEVRRSVRKDTGDAQTPWENTSLSGDFFFTIR